MGLAARDSELQMFGIRYIYSFLSKQICGSQEIPTFRDFKIQDTYFFFKHYNFMNFTPKLDDENSRGTFSCSIQAVIRKIFFESKMAIRGDLAIVYRLCATVHIY